VNILTVGSVALDSIETPAGTVTDVLGGSAVYFSIAASYFTKVNLVAVAGKDFPDKHINLLREKKIGIEGLEIDNRGETFRWKGKYGENLNEALTLETNLNVFENFIPKIPSSYNDAKNLFLGNIDPDLQLHVLEQVKSPAVIGLDTMNFWINGKNNALKKVIRKVHIVLLNDKESKLLAEKNNILEAAKEILSMGPQYVVIKRGEYGAVLISKNSRFWAPAYPVDIVIDPTGAGDSFAGGFMGCIAWKNKLEDEILRQAVICGTVMASFAVEDFSIRKTSQLNNEDIRKRYREIRTITDFKTPDEFA